MNALKNLRIWIVEDDASLLKVLKLALGRKCAFVLDALNGQQALEILSSQTVDLVLSDIQMPIVDGLELLATIRKINPNIPVVLFITGQAQVNEEQSILLGAAGLLAKPVRLKELVERIESLLSTGKLTSPSTELT
jgi:CheY-like chemotaxis protein